MTDRINYFYDHMQIFWESGYFAGREEAEIGKLSPSSHCQNTMGPRNLIQK
jgi:hypothetical protein